MHNVYTINRRGYGGQQKRPYCDARGLSLDLKHTGAPNSIEFLCLHLVIFVLMTTTTQPITYPLHMRVV